MLFWRKKNDDNDDDDDVDDFLTGQGHWEEFKTSILPGTPIVMALLHPLPQPHYRSTPICTIGDFFLPCNAQEEMPSWQQKEMAHISSHPLT